MSDFKPPEKAMFDTTFASLRTNLGLLCDEYTRAKLSLLRKIAAQIELEADPKKLLKLQAQLNQCLVSEADKTFATGVLTAFFALSAKNTAHRVAQSAGRADMEHAGQRHP